MFRMKKAKELGEACDTIYYQGNSNSQVQIVKYTGDRMVQASTGEFMWCEGKNKLKPLNVIYRPYIGPEIADVNLRLFDTFFSHFNPSKLLDQFWSYGTAVFNNIHFAPAINPTLETVRYYGINRDKSSIGQETDIDSHRKKYESWKNEKNRSKNLILWGVSRGTAATFCAMAKEKYPEVKLIVLEGAIDSIENVKSNIQKQAQQFLKFQTLTQAASLFAEKVYFPVRYQAYKNTGPSPLKSVADFPKGVPVVFITSEADKIVPCENTENIATTLAKQGNNEVFLLKLKKSSHPNYMFDNEEDRNNYECFIHAVYKRYNLKHDPQLAEQGVDVLQRSVLHEFPARYARKMSL